MSVSQPDTRVEWEQSLRAFLGAQIVPEPPVSGTVQRVPRQRTRPAPRIGAATEHCHSDRDDAPTV